MAEPFASPQPLVDTKVQQVERLDELFWFPEMMNTLAKRGVTVDQVQDILTKKSGAQMNRLVEKAMGELVQGMKPDDIQELKYTLERLMPKSDQVIFVTWWCQKEKQLMKNDKQFTSEMVAAQYVYHLLQNIQQSSEYDIKKCLQYVQHTTYKINDWNITVCITNSKYVKSP